MNRIYNVIWSKTKKCYVVVSEIVKSGGGKVKSLHTGKICAGMGAVMAVAALLAGVNITSVNAAAIIIDNVNNSGYATGQTGGTSWSYLYNYGNPGNKKALDRSASTGYYSQNPLTGVAIGHNTKIQETQDNTYYSGVAIGDYAQATGGLAFALGNYAQSTKPSAMAIGTASLSSGFNSLAMMRQSAATGNFSTAIGTTSWAKGTGSFAMGYSAQAYGDQSIAIGAAEPITVAGSGTEPSASYNGDTNTVTNGARSLAFGTKARTSAAAIDSMAFGSNSITDGANAVAVGNSANAAATDAFAFGNTAQALGANAIAMGRTAQAKELNAIALGGQAKALEANALAIGGTAEASKAGTMAIGTAAKASSNNATAIGNGAEVTGENSMALGAGAKISSNNSIALGAGTEFNGPLVNTYAAFTNEMNPAEAGVVAVGNTGTPRRIVNVAGGQNDNDAATIKQLRYVNNNLAMTIAGPTYTGYQANGSTYKAPDFNIKNSTYHTEKEAVEAAQTNFFSAKGTSADANYDNKGATGTNATAAGVRASAAGNFGTALGAKATATSDKSTALGYNAKVTEDDGVALGSNSVANTAAGIAGYDVSAADNRANKYTALTGNVATSTLGAVSVGQSTSVGNETRQITNLAAGTKDTDAVNVAQLRNVNLKIAGNTNDNNGKNDVLLDKQTLTVKGDGAYVTTKANNQTIDITLTNDTKDKIDNAANKDLSNITNVGKKNITALGTIVEAGHNVTIPAATVDTTTGQKTYTVNAMDTKVSLGTSGLMTLTGGTPDANGVRNYTVDVDPTKVAKTDLSNINNDGKTVIREEAQKAVKVIAGQNTTVTEGTDGTYKTYAVNVAGAGDYRLVENSATADKAYTVTGNKVDLTVQDASTPANTKTVTIKDIASKTELDSTKSDLTNKISDTKTELINKGLKFNADNNDVKTNKLGSTVTVSGDANITTKITQTGDDSTIAVALNKDLNVKTVTATDTVKAGTTTAGNQTATDNKGGTQTGNFVTGLDNTTWNMADPVFVSGRAATEDQLKKVSDAVRAANAGSSDYHLIGDPANTTDGSYKVTNNQVDLKVKDDKTGTTNTVTIKDIASKTEFDKLNDRAVKYDVDGSGNVDKSKVTYEGPTYSSTNKSGGTHVTNVAYATGNDGSEAVNVDYLTDKINDSSEALINKGMKFDANVGGVKTNKLGSTVKVQGEGTEADTNYSGKNIKTFIGQDSSGNTTIDVKMNKNLEVETVTATGANGKDGKIGINGKDGVTTNLSITRDGKPGVDGAAGTTTTRIVYEKPDGTKEEVATLNDGLKFKGDMGATSNVKLNKQVDVTGGVTNAADLATGNNIGVTSAAVDANGNAKLQLQLAKDITGLKSVTATDTVKAGTATVGNQTATDNKGGTQTGNFVTGLDNTNWNMTDPVFVPGRAATEDQLKTVSDAVKAASASASDYRLIGDPANTTDGSYKVTNNQVDLKVKDDKSGTTNTVTIKDIASKTELDKLEDRAVKYDLDPATNTVDKSKVTYEGPTYTNKTGGTHVTNVAYATGNDGSEAVNVDYLTDKIKDSSDALINKGLKFDANVGGVQTNKLGSTVLVKGEGNEADANYSGENIKTFIKQDNTTGNTTIDIKLNKNLVADSIKVNKDGRDGKDGVSITGPTGVAGQDGNNGKVGITGADGKDAVSISGKDGVGHIGLTGPAGTNGKDGTNGIDMSVKNGYDDATKGVKGEKGVDGVDGITRIVYTDNTGEHQVATMDDGMLYGGDAGNVIKKKLNNQVNVKGGITDETKLTAEDNIGVVSDGTDTLKVRLAKDLKGLNTVTAAKTVKAGTATVGNQEATKADGTKETGNYVTGLDNKTWDADNIVTGRAATEDQLKDALANQSNAGLKFDANVGGTKTNKLGSTVIVKGEGTDADANYSGENIKTFIDQDNTTGTTTINVKLNKNLVADSIKVNKDGKDGKDGVSITGPTGVAGQDGNNGKVGITGADGKDAVSISGKDGVGHIGLTGPAGTNGKDGTNGIDMSVKNGYDDAAKGVKGEKGVDGVDGITRIVYTDNTGEHQVATMDDGMLYGGDTGAVIKKKLNNQVNVKGGITDPAKFTVDDNIGVVSDGTDTLKVRLAKDLKGLNTVTATETVKAGDVVMGKQSDGTPAANTGNYVTGLDNKDWDVTNPTAVSGRAATEDQLKKVTEAINNQSSNSTDYRLVQNQTAGSNGDYTVDSNGDVALTVQDKNHPNQTETVTIKDVASKSNLDKLDDRAVKYDLDPATNTVDKSKVTYEGPTYTNKTGGTHVTNVAYATGNDGSEAVNVDYLTDKIKDSSDALINKGLKFDANVGGVQTNKLGSTVLVKGEGNEADANYSGENIKTFIKQDNTTGNTTIDIKLNKNLVADSIKVNKDGRDGKDGVSITGPTGVAGQDGNNGKVGITGADGKDAVSISGKDGVGHIGLTGPAGTNGKDGTNGIDMSVKNGYDDATKGVKGEKGVDGVDGITRIVYTDNTGEHQVATMDDGMLYGGDAGNVIKKKLNNQVNVKGGITDETKLTAEDNIGVVSDGTDTLKVRLAKDLKGLNTVTAAKTVKAGTATVGNQEATKADGTKETGNYVTGLDNKTWDADNIVTGRAATEDQLKDALANQSNAGLKFDANVGGTKTNKLGSTVIVKGEGTDADANYSGENIKTFIDQDNTTGTTTINVKLNKNLVADSIKVNKDGKDGKDGVSITGPTGVAGQDGNNGKVGITGADGKDAVSISGKDGVGHIGLTGPAGTNGKDGTNGIDMSVKNGYDDAAKGVKGEKGVDGIDGITRIVYTDKTGEHQVATMDDGMLYGGDSGTVIKKKLNNQVNVKGGITDAAKLSNDDNIGVVADGTDTLMLRLAKDLKGLNSATFNNGTDGNTVVNGGGLTINDAAGNPLTSVTKDGVVITDGPSMTKDGIDASDKKITNVADGTIGAGSKDAVNGGQLHTAVEDLKTKGFGLTAEDGASVKKSLGDTVTVKGDGTNITTSVDNGAVKVALARDLNVDTVTANTVTTGDTKMDTNGVTIKDGANEATKLTKDGLQINDGGNKAVTIDKDGLTIENGPKVTKDGINAGDKKITNVEDGTIAAGSKDAVNGGQLHTAIEDIKAQGFGLKAEDGQSVKKPLGEVIDLKGDGNIKTSVDGTAIKMSLNDTITLGTDPAKQVKVDGSTGTITAGNGANQVTIDGSTGSVTAGNTVKAGDVIMGNQSSGGQNGNFVTGLDNKTWNPNNPVAVTGRAATEDQLKAVNDDFNEKAKNGRVFQGDQAGNDGKVVRGLGDTMNLKGGADVNRLSDNNLAVVKNAAGDGYDIKLAKDLNLKDGSTTYTKTVPGTNTTIPYTVDTKVDGGGITITPSINGQPVPGHTVSLTENGLNNGNNTITNVAPGINGTDAVNVNQLRNAMHSVDGKIADVGAASAAMAGLKPLQYDPLEPTQVLAAVGNYKGSTAAAIGIAHYTNESTMLHMGVSLGGHDNMVNAGVSYKFGTSDAKKAIPARYKAGPISSAYVMQDEVTALKAENLRMKQRDEELSAKYEQVQRDNEEMKAQIAMLMKQAGLTK